MAAYLQELKKLDAYPKINEDFYSRTFSGGIITLFSSFFVLCLFFSELGLYLHNVTETKLAVDTSRGGTLSIVFDVNFPSVQCSLLSIDAIDISGEQHLDIRHNIVKKRINADGNVVETRQDGIGATKIEKPLQKHGGRLEHNEKYCGSCFGAEMSEDQCCNSCDEVRDAYRKKGWALTNQDIIDQCKREGFIRKVKDEVGEGCNIVGSLEVNKVAGNFHFAIGKSFQHANLDLNDLLVSQHATYNISHKINKLAFGDYFPGVVNPLDGVEWVHRPEHGVYQYFVKVVPTTYIDRGGHSVTSNQYSVTEHFKSTELGHSISGVFFYYDLSPIKVTLKEERTPFLHFMTHICAIIGGIFTIAGIVDSFVYYGGRKMKKKVEIGKFR